MGDEQLQKEQTDPSRKGKTCYKPVLDPAVVEEQPFYRKGMTAAEIQKELAYLNKNMSSFLDGTYMPLWKQGMYR